MSGRGREIIRARNRDWDRSRSRCRERSDLNALIFFSQVHYLRGTGPCGDTHRHRRLTIFLVHFLRNLFFLSHFTKHSHASYTLSERHWVREVRIQRHTVSYCRLDVRLSGKLLGIRLHQLHVPVVILGSKVVSRKTEEMGETEREGRPSERDLLIHLSRVHTETCSIIIVSFFLCFSVFLFLHTGHQHLFSLCLPLLGDALALTLHLLSQL
mmetsp:Transcript_15636/g.15755  ORF Transcript_15636/g.15755 Transcript_15636/m.15755 type:complete len:212 (-) Transcript_15636:2187-2822(-)